METKICTRCEKVLQATNEYFNKKKDGKYGLNSVCRECKHKEYVNNREHFIEKSRKHYKENKEIILEKSKDYRGKHIEDKKKYDKKYTEKHKEEKKKYLKEYAKKHKEKLEKYGIKYYKENKERIFEIVKRWKMNNIDKVKIIRKRRRNKKVISNLTLNQWEDIKKHFNNRCAYCGKELPLEQDHFIPLSKGGEYTINNIITACRSCNASKNNSNFFKWYPKQEYYNNTREKKILRYLNCDKKIQQLKII